MDIEPNELIAILTVICVTQLQMMSIVTALMQGEQSRECPPLIRHQI